ncbi:MAG: hypothetical protein AAF762_09295 [Pseudomonadota bacterium]
MSDNGSTPPVDLGIYPRNETAGLGTLGKVAIGLTVAWLGFCVLILTFSGWRDFGSAVITLSAVAVVLVPVVLVWIGAGVLHAARLLREESEHLQVTMEAMRDVYITQAQMSATTMGPNVERKIDEIVKGQKRAETALESFVSTRPVSQPTHPIVDEFAPESQPSLGLMGPEDVTVSLGDFILAMNFPETAEDAVGFAALRRALADHRASRLIQASQDVLTLLSQDGIYMDDLTPDRARPEVWRKFAAGERGGAIAGIGGIRDRASLSLTSSRMRKDSIFRDACHHFLRTFDQVFSEVADNMTDADMIRAVDTRTARAFMLIGRVAGMFD